MSSSIEQLLRTRLSTFLTAVNQANSLGFLHVYSTPPPNFPTQKSMCVEIESEEATPDRGEGGAHTSARKLNVKIALFWGAVLPATRTAGVEEKAYTVREAIEQSSWLVNEDAGTDPQFSHIEVTGLEKRYNPQGYVEAVVISTAWTLWESWTRDNTLAVPAAPLLYSAYTNPARTIIVTWAAGGPCDGYKAYISQTAKRPATPTATLANTVLTYTFTGLSINQETYYIWITAYNGVSETSSGMLTAQTSGV